MNPTPRTLSLLRRRGAWLVVGLGEGRAVRRWLELQRIPVTAVRDLAADAAARCPRRTVILVDPGPLDRATKLAHALGALERPPPLVVVSDALQRGLAELGWRGGTWGVQFVRAQLLHDDLPTALDDALAGAPELDESDGPPPAIDGLAEVRFDVDQLRRALCERVAWAGPVVERVGNRLELRARVPELDERTATLVLSWPETGDESLAVELHAPLPLAHASSSARRERGGLRGLIARLDDQHLGEPAFDATMEVRADRAGLAELRAQHALLDDLIALTELAVDRETLHASARGVARDDVLSLSDAMLALWRGLVRGRLGL